MATCKRYCYVMPIVYRIFSRPIKLTNSYKHIENLRIQSNNYSSASLSSSVLMRTSCNVQSSRKYFIQKKVFILDDVKLSSMDSFSTSAQEQLSLSNIKIDKYLTHLKHKYATAIEATDSDSIQIARNLKPLMDLLYQMESLKSDIDELQELSKDSSSDREMQELAKADLQEANHKLQVLEEEVLDAMVPSEPIEGTNVTIEVSAGVGGQEAMLFCQEVFNMYQAYADFMGWEIEVTSHEETDIGGLRRASANISGEGVYKILKYEGGIHRVQRIPKTEKSGRIHTSTISVAVMPQPSEIDVQIASKDLKIETKRASGAGGQHVNTTDSAVRVLHIPSGIVVESQKERSQHRNKEECMQKLRAHLYQKQLDDNLSKYSSSRRLQVGTKSRSEKIRTYNYPQDRVTDHRIGISIHNLPSLLQGSDDLHTLICQVINEAEIENLLEVVHQFCDSEHHGA